MGFMRNKNESYEQVTVKMDDRKIYVKVYDKDKAKVFEGMIHDWQLDTLLKLEYIMINSNEEYKIDKIFFDLSPGYSDYNAIYIYAKEIKTY